jgi:hypothetical protein
MPEAEMFRRGGPSSRCLGRACRDAEGGGRAIVPILPRGPMGEMPSRMADGGKVKSLVWFPDLD